MDGKNNIIIDCHTTPGNVHDSVASIGRLDKYRKEFWINFKQTGII